MYFAVVSTPPPPDAFVTSGYGDDAAMPKIIRVQNDNGEGRSTAVPLNGDTTGQDLLDCVRDPGYIMVHLVARWQRKEILVLPTDNIATLLRELEEEEKEEEEEGRREAEGGSEGVQFIVRYEYTDSPDGFCLSTEGRKSEQWRPHTPRGELSASQQPTDLPEAGPNMTLSELQALAARQQVAMETQQQALVARETRLKYLQQQEARHQQLSSEEARLQLMRERVEEQELKLRRLRALRGQVEQYRAHNGHLNGELEAVRALFNQKEKELALAVSRVDTLMKQLQELREVKAKEVTGHGNTGRGNSKALTLELEKLRKELAQRNQINTQYTSHLAAQKQLLQQRKDQAAKMDARIEELQQRLKKRRSQQPPPPPQPWQQSQLSSTGESGETGSRGLPTGQGRKRGQNVAAVEPYIQHPPKDTDKKDPQSKGADWKQEPKSHAVSCPKISEGGDASIQHGVPRPPPGEEVNNNDKGDEGGGGDQVAREYQIPSIISSHFDARRARGSSVGKGTMTGQKSRGEGVETGVPLNSATFSQSSNMQGLASTPSQNSAGNVIPVLNSFGKPGSLTKWPPSAVSSEGSELPPPSLQQIPHHPHINIFDEERQAGSGQSSPASSEGSGPLVKQGSGVFTHHLPTTSSSGHTVPSTAPSLAQTSQKDVHKNGAQSVSSVEPRGQHSGRQAPKPPPRMPQTVLHSRAPAIPSSSSSAPLPSSSAPPSSSSAPFLSSSTPFSSSSSPLSSPAAPFSSSSTPFSSSSTPFSSSSTSFSSSSTPFSSSSTPFSSSSTPFSSSSTPFSSADSPSSAATSGVSQPSVISQSGSSDPATSRDVPRKQDAHQKAEISNSSSAGPSEQEGDGKVGTTIHLNQRPAPTYRYASKNTITNTYTSRQGSGALRRYQQLNQQMRSSDSNGSTEHRPTEGSTDSQNSATVGDDSNNSKSDTQPSPTDKPMLVGTGTGGMTHFGLVGSPNYPDIASDKGSYKSNTPKQVRRRHSDSDNEELVKMLKRGDRLELEQLTEDGANSSGTDSQPDPPTPSVPSPSINDHADGAPPSPTKAQSEAAAQKTSVVTMRARRTILKGDNKRKSSNRVSFDPLALLLDASLEGELDLVMRTAREVDDVSRPNDEGITALHNAICAGHYHIVKFLIEFGADVNSPDSDGWTPLHCAASCNNLPMVRFLVEHGACLFATTHSDHETAAEKCEEDEDGYDHCSDYLYGVQEKLGIANSGAVYAVFDYTANKRDELSFRINDKLTVIRKGDDEEKEWWWATGPNSREGYIPRNLLGLCPRVLPPNISFQPLQTSDC